MCLVSSYSVQSFMVRDSVLVQSHATGSEKCGGFGLVDLLPPNLIQQHNETDAQLLWHNALPLRLCTSFCLYVQITPAHRSRAKSLAIGVLYAYRSTSTSGMEPRLTNVSVCPRKRCNHAQMHKIYKAGKRFPRIYTPRSSVILCRPTA
jgi:hypothetical protein